MTEQEWMASEDPGRMLRCLRRDKAVGDEVFLAAGPVRQIDACLSPRKLRLFACAVALQVWGRLDARQMRAVEAGETFADWNDSTLASEAMGRAYRMASEAYAEAARGSIAEGVVAWIAAMCATADSRHLEGWAASQEFWESFLLLPEGKRAAPLLRDIAGNPFRPLPRLRGWVHQECKVCGATPDAEGEVRHGKGCYRLDDDGGGSERAEEIVTPWLTPTVLSLAAAAYEERDGLTRRLEPARLAVLSDALEEAGCDCEPLLDHLRGMEKCRGCHPDFPGAEFGGGGGDYWCPRCGGTQDMHKGEGWARHGVPPYRGTWSLDIVLGKEGA